MKYAILLTTVVHPFFPKSDSEPEERKQLYVKQIKTWLETTPYNIYVVESSGYSFCNDISHERLFVLSFTFPNVIHSSSQSEAQSLLFALQVFERIEHFQQCDYIFKCTGRYHLQNLIAVMDNVEPDRDLYLQIHRYPAYNWQNSEYYCIKKNLLQAFLQGVCKGGLMEKNLFSFSRELNYTTIGPFPNDQPRAGDNITYTLL
jgi:hypothetical protein